MPLDSARLLLRLAPLFAAAAVLAALYVAVPAFSRATYWSSLPREHFATAALALALTPIVLTGGIDLSVGTNAVLSSLVVGVLHVTLGLPFPLAVAGGVLAGLAGGLANAALVNAGVLPLVATLATRELFSGLAVALSGDQGFTAFPADARQLWRTSPAPLVALAVLWSLTAVAVHRTRFGRWLFALGDNPTAAVFARVPVARVNLALYAWAGLVAGLCGATLTLKYGAAKADAERGLELAAIACVVMGGVRVTGGEGGLFGVVLGVVTVCALASGLTAVASDWRDTVTGVALISVALLGELARRLEIRLLRLSTSRNPS